MVTLLEDLHWFDGASDAYLAQLVDALPATPGLLLLNFRPEYRADWMGRPHYRQLPLRPLGADAVEDLLCELLGAESSASEPHEAANTASARARVELHMTILIPEAVASRLDSRAPGPILDRHDR